MDLWLDGLAGDCHLTTNLGEMGVDLSSLGLDAMIASFGGLARQLCVTRLPDTALARNLRFQRNVSLNAQGDTPIWICVTTEDGHQAWSSPIYLFQEGNTPK